VAQYEQKFKMVHELSEDSIAEMRKLRAEIAAMRQHQQTERVMRHGWLKFVVKDLETNPRTQYKVHFYGAIYWLINFPLVAALFFLAPTVWLKWGIFITLVYSIYANFATDYGAMSAAMAAFGQDPLPEIPSSAHVEAKSDDSGH
jgi:hypothetical protein